MSVTTPRIDLADLKSKASGQWESILAIVGGIDRSILDGRPHPCPKCGGTDRFRMIDEAAGSLFCNQCFDHGNGDGIAAIQWLRGVDFVSALKIVAEYLRIEPSPATNGKPRTTATNGKPVARFATPKQAVDWLATKFGTPLAKWWEYKNERGELAVIQTRFNLLNGAKEYRPISRHPGGSGVCIKSPDGLRPMYRLPELLDATVIYIVEGEKAADAAVSIGLIATTSLNGAKSPQKTNWKPLKGKAVVVLPDNDKPGRDYAEAVAKLCHEAGAASIKIVELLGLTEGDDLVEWLESHGDAAEPQSMRQELEALADAAPVYRSEQATTPITKTATISTASSVSRILAVGTRVQCGDRNNIGDVVRDDGGPVVMVHFISISGSEATKDIPREQIKFEDGRPVVPSGFKLNLISSRDFAAADYKLRYLVKSVLVEGQPCIVGGPRKGLKTGTLIDLAVSLGTGTPFLGKPEFAVPEPVNVAILSGESGLYTLQETAKRVAFAHGVNLDDARIWWEDRLPQISNPEHLDALRDAITENAIKVCVIDPAYLCLMSGDTRGRQASNLFDVGALLMGLVDIGRDTRCGIVLAHHTRKNPAEPFAIPELEELAYAGFAEFARQWILLNRRSTYEGGGRHDLWLAIGGSAGHSSTWAYSVEEGVPDEWFRGRFWDVTVTTAADAIEAKHRDREREKENDLHSRMMANVERIMDYLRQRAEPQTKKEIRDGLGLNSTNFNSAFGEILKRNAVEITTKKSANRQTYDAYFVSSGHRDTSGQNTRCPDAPMTDTHIGTGGYVNSPCPDVLCVSGG